MNSASDSITQFIIYTRPVEVRFHLELAAQLARCFPGVPIRFYTFFILAHRLALEAGYESHYFPTRLAAKDPRRTTNECLTRVDEELTNDGGANLMLQLGAERFRPAGRAAQLDYFKRHVALLDEVVRPGTVSISSMYDHFVYWLGGSLANARNGAHFAFVGAPIPSGRVQALRTAWDQWIGPEDPEADRLYDECCASLHLPPAQRIAYMAPIKTPNLLGRLGERIQEIRADLHDQRNGSNFKGAGFNWADAWRWRWEKILPPRGTRDFDLYQLDEIGKSVGKYVYVPLHMEPEASIFMYSPWLHDQVELCRLIAQALPPDVSLLAKENPKMMGQRSKAFVRKIGAIPNLRYVHPGVSSHDLIQNAEMTVTLTGTAGLEAKMLGKRVAVLAHPPYAFALEPLERIGTCFSVRQLKDLLSRPGTPLSRANWRQLVRGTFPGEAVPVWGEKRIEIDYSERNAASHLNFMKGCLGLPRSTQKSARVDPFRG